MHLFCELCLFTPAQIITLFAVYHELHFSIPHSANNPEKITADLSDL